MMKLVKQYSVLLLFLICAGCHPPVYIPIFLPTAPNASEYVGCMYLEFDPEMEDIVYEAVPAPKVPLSLKYKVKAGKVLKKSAPDYLGSRFDLTDQKGACSNSLLLKLKGGHLDSGMSIYSEHNATVSLQADLRLDRLGVSKTLYVTGKGNSKMSAAEASSLVAGGLDSADHLAEEASEDVVRILMGRDVKNEKSFKRQIDVSLATVDAAQAYHRQIGTAYARAVGIALYELVNELEKVYAAQKTGTQN